MRRTAKHREETLRVRAEVEFAWERRAGWECAGNMGCLPEENLLES